MSKLIIGVVLGALLGRSVRSRLGSKGLFTEGVRTAHLARLLFRALERLYDLGLGRLVGHRFLRLTHRGRHSGRLYHTVLEVISYEPTTRESVVLSGWGQRADWYRNIRATPALEVLTAGQRYRPVQRFLNGRELYAHLQSYAKHNRWMRRVLTRTLGLMLDGSEADRVNLEARGYLGVAFRPV
jgi:deazaflavin-dependent oxidoreductase (nitroreductase family)